MVGYQSVPWTEQNVKVVYLLADALTEETPEGVPSESPSAPVEGAVDATTDDASESKKRRVEADSPEEAAISSTSTHNSAAPVPAPSDTGTA
jgi:hypothetical protein